MGCRRGEVRWRSCVGGEVGGQVGGVGRQRDRFTRSDSTDVSRRGVGVAGGRAGRPKLGRGGADGGPVGHGEDEGRSRVPAPLPRWGDTRRDYSRWPSTNRDAAQGSAAGGRSGTG